MQTMNDAQLEAARSALYHLDYHSSQLTAYVHKYLTAASVASGEDRDQWLGIYATRIFEAKAQVDQAMMQFNAARNPAFVQVPRETSEKDAA
jgi:hypothetical protein